MLETCEDKIHDECASQRLRELPEPGIHSCDSSRNIRAKCTTECSDRPNQKETIEIVNRLSQLTSSNLSREISLLQRKRLIPIPNRRC